MSCLGYESVKLDGLANNQSSDTCDSLMSSSNKKQGANNQSSELPQDFSFFHRSEILVQRS